MIDEVAPDICRTKILLWNTIPLIETDFGATCLMGTKPLNTMEALKGTKIRTYGKANADFIAALGATPVAVNWGELYMALQRGVVDGLMTPPDLAYTTKFWEVLKYVTYYAAFTRAMYGLGLNKDAFYELPADLQAMVKGTSDEIAESTRARNVGWDAEYILKGLVDYNITVSGVSKNFETAVGEKSKPLWDAWLAEVGPEGAELLDEIQEANAQWLASH